MKLIRELLEAKQEKDSTSQLKDMITKFSGEVADALRKLDDKFGVSYSKSKKFSTQPLDWSYHHYDDMSNALKKQVKQTIIATLEKYPSIKNYFSPQDISIIFYLGEVESIITLPYKNQKEMENLFGTSAKSRSPAKSQLSSEDSAKIQFLKDLAAFDKNVQDRLIKLDMLFDVAEDMNFEFGALTVSSLKWFYDTPDPMPSNLKSRVRTIINQEFKKLPSLTEFMDVNDLKFTRIDLTEIDLEFKGGRTRLPAEYEKLIKLIK